MKTESFGTTAGGVKATLYTLENKNHTVVKVTDLGATLVSVLYADKEGKLCDMNGRDEGKEHGNESCINSRR